MGVGADLWYRREELYNKQDLLGIVALYSDDALIIDHPGSTMRGHEQMRAYLAALAGGITEVTHSTSLLIEDGNNVVGEWVFRSTYNGAVHETVGISVAVVADGKIAELRSYFHDQG